MEVRRLAWAGLEINAGGQALVIDLVEDFPSLHGGGPPTGEMPPSPAAGTSHRRPADDPAGAALSAARELGVTARAMGPGEQIQVEPSSIPDEP